MKKYRVNVNGTVFEVEIEEMTGAPAAPAVAAAAPAAPAAPAGGEKITAPMPGTILAVNVTSGSAVKKGGHEDGKRDHGALRRHRHLRVRHQGGRRGVRHPAVHHRLTPEGRIWKQLPIS